MLAVKVRKESAEKVKRYLARRKLMNNNYRIIRSDEFIYFPLARRLDGAGAKTLAKMRAELSDSTFPKSGDRSTYREMLERQLRSRYDDVVRGYDVIGEIAVIDAEKRDAKAVGRAIMSLNKNVKTVLSKAGPVTGRYRTRKYSYVLGKRQYSTIYRENGAAFRLDVRKAFFSTRLAYERGRVSDAAKEGENVVVMFAGVGPFAIEIAKRYKKSNVVAIELNRGAYSYLLDNIRINRLKNVVPELGDVNDVAKKYRNFADRIVMPLPKDSYEFLDSVVAVAKKRCVVHYYAFGDKDNAFVHHIEKLRGFFADRGKRFRVLYKRVVRTYSAKEIEIVIDFLIY